MKKIYTLIIIIWLASHTSSMGQCQEDKTIITNPDNPVNTELFSNHRNINQWRWGEIETNGTDKWFKNIEINTNATWDQSYMPYGQPWALWSPFHSQTGSNYQYLWQQTGIDPDDVDWHWEDGWELMWLNTGYFPNNDEINDWNVLPAHETSPYFVLYNRYTGKLRWFGNHFKKLGIGTSPQNVDLEIEMSSHLKSGMFRHLGSYDQALDKESKYTFLHANNQHPGSNQRFYSNDFHLGYDPCVCQFDSELSFRARNNTSFGLSLLGRGISLKGGINDYPDDFLTNRSIKKSGTSMVGPSGGSLIFKNLQKMHEIYEDSMLVYEQKLANYNKPENQIKRELVEIAKDLAKFGILTLIDPSAGVKSAVASFMTKINSAYNENNATELAKGIIKTGDAFLARRLDHFTKQYINQDDLTKPLIPTLPTATFSEMIITGTMEHSDEYPLFVSKSPGSFKAFTHSFTGYNYPIYNKPTGLYALLKTPKIAFGNQISSQIRGNFEGYLNYGSWSNHLNLTYMKVDKRIGNADLMASHQIFQDLTFKLDEKLLYKLNRNLDINDEQSNVLVSFQIELEGNLPFHIHQANTQLGENRLEIDLTKTNYEILNHEPATDNTSEKIVLEIPWHKIEKSATFLNGGTVGLTSYFKYGVREIEERRTRYYDINMNLINEVHEIESDSKPFNYLNFNFIDSICVENIACYEFQEYLNLFGSSYISENTNFIFIPKKEDVELSIKSIKMKVLTDLTFEQESSRGGEINTTQVFTYLIYDNTDPGNGVDLIESNGRYMGASEISSLINSSEFHSHITIGNETIHTGSPHVSFTMGNELWVRADGITIVGYVDVQPGYKVILYVSEDGPGVDFLPGAYINIVPDIEIRWFKSKFERFPWNKSKEATNAQVNDFCTDNNEYKAKQSAASILQNNDDDDTENPFIEEFFNKSEPNPSRLYPNPTNGYFMIAFERILDTDSELVIADLSGRTVQTEKLKKGSSGFQIFGSNLSNGIYFVSITQGGNKTTHKIVVSKE